MRSTIESEIRARVEAFADELVSLIQTSALEAVQGALGENGSASRRRGRGASAPDKQSFATSRGGKRDPEVIAALTDELAAFIAANPGKRIEEISSALQTPTRDLVLPVRRLIAAKRVTTRGQKRATTYFPGGARAGGSARAAGGRKKAARSAGRPAKKRGKRAAAKSPRPRAGAKRRRGAGKGDAAAQEKASSAEASASSE